MGEGVGRNFVGEGDGFKKRVAVKGFQVVRLELYGEQCRPTRSIYAASVKVRN